MASDEAFIELWEKKTRGQRPNVKLCGPLPRVIKREQVALGPPREVKGETQPLEGPVLKVHQRDGVVQGMEVICPCGRVIRIKCDYEEL